MLAEIISDIILYKATIETKGFNEAAVRQFIVLPILRALGWRYNEFSTLEIYPEVETGAGRIDYALQHNMNPIVFIECKRWGVTLGNHQERLREYSSADTKVDIAVLTNGKLWEFYLPDRGSVSKAEKVPWQDRMFCSIDLEEQQEARENFHKYLSKPNVEQGIARQEAEEAMQPQKPNTPLPRRHYALPILRALDQLGGCAPSNEVLNTVHQLMADDLREIDRSSLPSGQLYWKNRAHNMRWELVNRKLMKDDSPREIWEISDVGRESLHPQMDRPLPQSRYELPILVALSELGGSAATHEVLRRVRQLMVDELREIDISRRSDRQVYMESRAHAMRLALVRRGLMRNDSPRGTWEITDAGREYLRNNQGD